jgi:hypothetical protein
MAREKNDAPPEGGILLLEQGIERAPVECRQPQVRHEHVIGIGIELSERVMAILGRLRLGAIPAQELGASPRVMLGSSSITKIVVGLREAILPPFVSPSM